MICRFAVCLALAGMLTLPAFASAAEPKPFADVSSVGGLTCTSGALEGNVRFCPGSGTTTRIPSWDGVPLDVDVTLPPATAGNGPFPTIVMLHGYGGAKTEFESTTAAGSEPETYDYNNDYYAQHGYAVVNYTARGFGKSCGGNAGLPTTETATTPACIAHGFIHLADQRYEARDTQYLLGVLAEEGIAKPGALGVTGLSYGGGQSIELAYLKNRIRCAGPEDAEPAARTGTTDPCEGRPENVLVPWTTPDDHTALAVDAAYARWPWSDLVSALIPNGRFLDYDNATDGEDGATGSGSPIGVPIQSYITGLYAEGAASGYYEPATGSPEWNLTKDFTLIAAGEPQNPEDQTVVNSIAAYHGGYVLGGAPAPLLMESGWNDDLFPPLQALRVYNSVRAQNPGADVALQFGDIGHSRGSNKATVNQYFNAQAAAFFGERLKGEHEQVETAETKEKVSAPAPGNVTTFTTTCPSNTNNGATPAPDGGPFGAASWTAIEKGVVTFSSSTEQTVTNPGGNPKLGTEFDPIAEQESSSSAGACTTATAEEPVGTASYGEQVAGSGFTLMGLPTVIAKITPTGTANGDGQLDARLWDVAPGGEERLISRGGYRLSEPETPQIVFQLHGNGYKFPAGDTVKLELTSNDAPYYRASNGAFTVKVQSATVVLPTLDAPNGGQIQPPESVILPLPESALSFSSPPSGPLPSSPSTTTASGSSPSASAPPKCQSKRKVRISLPRYRHARIVSVVVFVNGKRTRTVHGRSLRSVLVSFKGRHAGPVTVRLRLRVRRGKHVKTHTLTRRYHLCVAGRGHAK